ncbi:hypothetical protein Hanom_Chr09g00790601 [Helianthus anomalus]
MLISCMFLSQVTFLNYGTVWNRRTMGIRVLSGHSFSRSLSIIYFHCAMKIPVRSHQLRFCGCDKNSLLMFYYNKFKKSDHFAFN